MDGRELGISLRIDTTKRDNTMSTFYLTIGFCGSGKSTWSKNFIKDKPSVKIVSSDSFRTMLNGEYEYIEGMDNVITLSCLHTVMNLIAYGYDVIIDCGNLTTASDRRGLWQLLAPSVDQYIAVVFPTDKPPQWYVNRRMQKPHWEKVDWLTIVKNEMKAYEPPTEEEFTAIWKVDEHGKRVL